MVLDGSVRCRRYGRLCWGSWKSPSSALPALGRAAVRREHLMRLLERHSVSGWSADITW